MKIESVRRAQLVRRGLRKKPCIGLTIFNLHDVERRIFSNGLNQHVFMYIDIIEKKLGYDYVLVTNSSKKFKGTTKHPHCCFNRDESYANFDILVSLGLHSSSRKHKIMKIMGIPSVYVRLGNDFCLDMYNFFKNPGEVTSKYTTVNIANSYDETWISDHFAYSLAYYKYLTDGDVFVLPYFWSSDFVTLNKKDVLPVARGNVCLGVFESNYCNGKNAIMPTVIAKAAEEYCKSISIFGLKQHDKKEWYKVFTSRAGAKCSFFHRHPFQEAVCKEKGVANVVVSWVDDWDLNFLHFECFHLGIPLVHNSKMLKEYGFYYEANDVAQAVAHIRRLNENGFDRDAYILHNQRAITKFSIEGCGVVPFLRTKFAGLLENRPHERVIDAQCRLIQDTFSELLGDKKVLKIENYNAPKHKRPWLNLLLTKFKLEMASKRNKANTIVVECTGDAVSSSSILGRVTPDVKAVIFHKFENEKFGQLLEDVLLVHCNICAITVGERASTQNSRVLSVPYGYTSVVKGKGGKENVKIEPLVENRRYVSCGNVENVPTEAHLFWGNVDRNAYYQSIFACFDSPRDVRSISDALECKCIPVVVLESEEEKADLFGTDTSVPFPVLVGETWEKTAEFMQTIRHKSNFLRKMYETCQTWWHDRKKRTYERVFKHLSLVFCSDRVKSIPSIVSPNTDPKYYYINLSASTERRKHMETFFESNLLPRYQRVEAYDVQREGGYPAQNEECQLIPGEYGCLRSHLKAMRAFLEDKTNAEDEWAFICEDDLDICDAAEFKRLGLHIARELPRNWGVYQCGITAVHEKLAEKPQPSRSPIHWRWGLYGTVIYAVKRTTAQYLVDTLLDADGVIVFPEPRTKDKNDKDAWLKTTRGLRVADALLYSTVNDSGQQRVYSRFPSVFCENERVNNSTIQPGNSTQHLEFVAHMRRLVQQPKAKKTNTTAVSCVLRGGLGNQMFVLFATLAYALDHGIEFNRIYLPNFKGTPTEDLKGMRGTYWDGVFCRLKARIDRTGRIERCTTKKFKEKYFAKFAPLPAPSRENDFIQLDGYFQSYRYFGHRLREVCDTLGITEAMSPLPFQRGVASMHFRIGDYRASPIHPVLPESYYVRAIDHLPTTVKGVHWCCEKEDEEEVTKMIESISKKIKNPQIKFTQINPDLDEVSLMFYMSTCEHNIIANSTFSWWSAMLNPNKLNTQIVLYPGDVWVDDGVEDKSDLFPPEWTPVKSMNDKGEDNTKVLVVSGYWNLAKSKHGSRKYREWMKNSLQINAPYVLFTDDIEGMKEFRSESNTEFRYRPLDRFETVQKYQPHLKGSTHPVHVPSEELGFIWLEKMAMVKEAADCHPEKEWFVWVDAGLPAYRKTKPPTKEWPSSNTTAWSKSSINVSTCEMMRNVNRTQPQKPSVSAIQNFEYVHLISGSSFCLHRNIVKKAYDSFYATLGDCLLRYPQSERWQCFSDQIIFSNLYVKQPNFFKHVARGYSGVVTESAMNATEDVVLVTALYDIGRGNLNTGQKRTFEDYLDWFNETLKLNCPMVVFVEEENVDFVKQKRIGLPKTIIIAQALDEIPYYCLHDKIKTTIQNLNPLVKDAYRIECSLPMYTVIQYSKFEWLNIASQSYDHQEDVFFCWVDAGISRFTQKLNSQKTTKFPNPTMKTQMKLCDKFWIQKNTKYYPDLFSSSLKAEYLCDSRSFIVGTIFGGKKEVLKTISELVRNVFEVEMMEKRQIVNNEQIVLAFLLNKHPHLFRVFENHSSDVLPVFETMF